MKRKHFSLAIYSASALILANEKAAQAQMLYTELDPDSLFETSGTDFQEFGQWGLDFDHDMTADARLAYFQSYDPFTSYALNGVRLQLFNGYGHTIEFIRQAASTSGNQWAEV